MNPVKLLPAEEQLCHAMLTIAKMAEECRQSVNEIVSSIRQIDMDSSSAITRGHCMSIGDKARASVAEYLKAKGHDPAAKVKSLSEL